MTSLLLRDLGAAADLATFSRRTSSFDAESVIRLVARGSVTGCFAATPFDALALRSFALGEPAELDVVLVARALAASASTAAAQGRLDLPAPVAPLRWTGPLPPRSGWRELARLPDADVTAKVEAGIADFRARVEAMSEPDRTRLALQGVAEQVWGQHLYADATLGLAHAAHAYGFLAPGSEVVLRTAGAWQRLDCAYGTVLARMVDPLGLYFG